MNIIYIPRKKMPDIEKINISEKNEPFVDIEEYSKGKILVDMQYALSRIEGAVNIAYMRKSVADKLLMALDFLPKGYTFKIFDAWRPYVVQKKLYDDHFEKIKKSYPNLADQELHTLAKVFVSFPDKTKRVSFVHSSGGALDLTITDENGFDLDMGTQFDDFSDMSVTDAYEQKNSVVTKNRRILYNAMISAGFTNYPSEWWHYDYGDVFWSAITNKPVKYTSVYTIKEMIIWR